MLEKITEAEINERSMARVSNTPGRRTAFGQSEMDAEALKLRFDRLGRFLAGKINEILGSLEDGSIAEFIYVDHNGNKISVEQFITNLLNGDVDNIKIKTSYGIVYLTEIALKTEEMYNGQFTGDSANQLYIVDGVTLKGFYEEFKQLEESGVGGGNGKSAYDYAVEGGYQGSEEDFAKKLAEEIPKKISELENDEYFISADKAPVQRVNDKTGYVKLNAEDVGARSNTWMPTAEQVGARPNTWTPTYSDIGAEQAGTAQSAVDNHNVNNGAHNDIRIELKALADRINAALDSDDTTLDELSEIVAYIKSNKDLIDYITTSKVNVADIVNNLTSNVTHKPLSAAQGVALKLLIDNLTTNKLDASALTSAINTALAQAKESGEFDGADGEDGYSIYNSIEKHPEVGSNFISYLSISGIIAGGRNIQVGDFVILSNRYLYKISDAESAESVGVSLIVDLKGDKGDNGTSVTVKSVSESTTDGGSNVVTFSDGKTLTIKNGSKGSDGTNGTNGTNGKSAYQYAKDGGYTGTEAEFTSKMAQVFTTETWTFELEDGSTVTKKIAIGT